MMIISIVIVFGFFFLMIYFIVEGLSRGLADIASHQAKTMLNSILDGICLYCGSKLYETSTKEIICKNYIHANHYRLPKMGKCDFKILKSVVDNTVQKMGGVRNV